MRYLEFLRGVHERLDPPTYVEIGVRHGDSLALARAPAVGIDPELRLRVDVPPTATLFEETSDDHFARARPLEPLGGRPVGLAFVDGMHLLEFALRDFVHVERHADWTSVVVFDDVLPRSVEEASRERRTRAWTGDVYKILGILDRHRHDLVCLRVATEPTGLLVVLGLDPGSRVLADRLEMLSAAARTPDPQPVPRQVLRRQGALPPHTVLAGSFWGVLRAAREAGIPREEGLPALRRAVRRDFGLIRAARGARRLLPARS